jgi:uncharacterized membrane protein YcfT
MSATRIAWLDHAKGLCIVLVVVLYATELVERTMGGSGWLGNVAAFAQPFRMPAFFLLSALLLARVIERDWRTYLDRKVVHFAYFYVLWLTILVAFQSPRMAEEHGWGAVGAEYAKAFVHPFSMLWFIYLLPVFFVVTRVLRRVPAALVWTAAAALQLAAPDVGPKVLDKFAGHYVYFYTGFVLAPLVARFADAVERSKGAALAGLLAWAAANAWLVFAGHAEQPLVFLGLALIGCAAVVAIAALVCAWRPLRPLGYCGEHSIVIYLGFLIPLETTRKALEVAGLALDPGWTALVVTLGGVMGALATYWLVRGTRLRFLFERPAQFSLAALPLTPATSR